MGRQGSRGHAERTRLKICRRLSPPPCRRHRMCRRHTSWPRRRRAPALRKSLRCARTCPRQRHVLAIKYLAVHGPLGTQAAQAEADALQEADRRPPASGPVLADDTTWAGEAGRQPELVDAPPSSMDSMDLGLQDAEQEDAVAARMLHSGRVHIGPPTQGAERGKNRRGPIRGRRTR